MLQRASAAGAEFVAIPQKIMELSGYEFKEGVEGTGYYLLRRAHIGGGVRRLLLSTPRCRLFIVPASLTWCFDAAPRSHLTIS